MKSKLLIIIAFIVTNVPLSFAEGDSLCIKITAPQLKNKPLTLNMYFNRKIFTVDSLTTSDKGTGSFHKPDKLEEGLYLIYIDSIRYFDVLLTDRQSFHIQIDTTDMITENKISGAEQSEAFIEYARYISEKQKEQTKLFDLKKKLNDENKSMSEVNQKIDQLNKEVMAFQNSFDLNHQGQWVGKFFSGLNPVIGPFPNPKSREEAVEEFYFQKDHFFDNIDLQDKRFWWTNYFPQKVIQYMQSQVEQDPDSLANAASKLVAGTLGDSICSRMMLTTLLNFSTGSDIMGMENIWAKLAEDYFLKGYATWADSTLLAEMKAEYNKIRFCRIGMKTQNIILQDSIQQRFSLHDSESEYTLLCFFEPGCGHCKKVIPQIYNELYGKYGGNGLDVTCVYLLSDRKEWLDFVHEHGLKGEHWNNLWDPDRTSHYWQFYDISITPALFLLDKDKKIIAKRLGVESLGKMLKNLLE